MNTDFKKYFTQLFKKPSRDRLKIAIHPDRDWRMVFALFWACFAFMAVWSSFLYFSFSASVIPPPGSQDLPAPLSKELFNPVFESFDARAKEFENARSAAPSLGDPRK